MSFAQKQNIIGLVYFEQYQKPLKISRDIFNTYNLGSQLKSSQLLK